MGRSGDPRKRNPAAPPPPGDDETIITIVSGRDPRVPASCLLSWQGHDWVAGVDRVRATAVDLVTAAAWAELMMLLIVKTRLPVATVSAMAGDLLARSGRTELGSQATVMLTPVGSSATRTPLVLLRRGPLQGLLTTTGARDMGLTWLAAAEAAESDRAVTQALRVVGEFSEPRIEALFDYLRGLRSPEVDHG
ncbi:hypothetical protein HCN51_31620 [Nonomuraea sp. FMUSA5-5]|uniref:Uncharacterized protein n=1 Tax=Nonomuraea composti TaxID=2720023 RepID=A0ABX1BDW3_9ACTN|nr:hypothetical protein [Nonomuraea sp. FMUSA5-5]NJP93934.1 hypothetical protein [Nonomuraea sp. FMUSA5-5]